MNPDFVECLAALLRTQSRFLVVGAHALAVYGVPRATGDIDIWIDRSPENTERVWAALIEFGAPAESLGLNGLTIPFLGRISFIKNKRATGRLKDLADIEALGEIP